LIAAYRIQPRKRKLDQETVQNLLGVEAALQWVLGYADDGPVADTIRDLKSAFTN
jgi:hypothetical protein